MWTYVQGGSSANRMGKHQGRKKQRGGKRARAELPELDADQLRRCGKEAPGKPPQRGGLGPPPCLQGLVHLGRLGGGILRGADMRSVASKKKRVNEGAEERVAICQGIQSMLADGRINLDALWLSGSTGLGANRPRGTSQNRRVRMQKLGRWTHSAPLPLTRRGRISLRARRNA